MDLICMCLLTLCLWIGSPVKVCEAAAVWGGCICNCGGLDVGDVSRPRFDDAAAAATGFVFRSAMNLVRQASLKNSKKSKSYELFDTLLLIDHANVNLYIMKVASDEQKMHKSWFFISK